MMILQLPNPFTLLGFPLYFFLYNGIFLGDSLVEVCMMVPFSESRTRRLILLMIAILSLSALTLVSTGCRASSDDAAVSTTNAESAIVDYRATDYLGHVITLAEPPEKIIIAGKSTLIAADAVALFPEAASRIIALGLTNQGMGDFYQTLTPGLRVQDRLPHTVSAEEIAAYDPDIVFIKERSYNPLGERLVSLDIPVFALYLEEPGSYSQEIRELGRLLGQNDRAESIVAYYESVVDRVEQSVSASADGTKKRVLLLNTSVQDGNLVFSVPPVDWIQTSMVRTAGGEPVWQNADLSSSWTQVNMEQITVWDPDVIFIVNYKASALDVVRSMEEDPLWRELRSIREGAVFAFPNDYHSWGQPDSRWILGLLWLHDTLSDNTDRDLSIEQEIERFYTFLYGVEDPSVIAQIIRMYHDSIDK